MRDELVFAGSAMKSSTPSANTETALGIWSIRELRDVGKLTPAIMYSLFVLSLSLIGVIHSLIGAVNSSIIIVNSMTAIRKMGTEHIVQTRVIFTALHEL